MNDSLSTERALSALAARRRSLYLRVHCWAALIATPFLLLATLTGLLYVFVPQIEARLYEGLDRVAPRGVMLPLDRSVAAAQGAVPMAWRCARCCRPSRPATASRSCSSRRAGTRQPAIITARRPRPHRRRAR